MTRAEAARRVAAHFPNSQFRITIVEEWARKRRKKKKSFVSIAVFNNVIEEAPTLEECVETICEWVERKQW